MKPQQRHGAAGPGVGVPLAAGFGLWIACTAVAAQSFYSCRDHAGRTITSDRPIAECAGVMREIGASGVVKREIAPPLTGEQLRQKELDDKARRSADEAVREKRRRDSALLAAYQNEEQIEAARRRALADADESIRTSRARLAELQKDQVGLVAEGETYKPRAAPPLVRRRIDDNQALIDEEEASIRSRQTDVERINARYDDDRTRYRDLTTKVVGR